MKSEIESNFLDYRVYVDKEPNSYIAHCDVKQYCDVAIISGMQGPGLLRMLAADLDNGSLRERSIVSVQGYVLPVVGKHCEHAAKHFPNLFVEYGRTCVFNGREFVWINVERNH